MSAAKKTAKSKKAVKTTLWGDVRHPARDLGTLFAQAGESEPLDSERIKRWLSAYLAEGNQNLDCPKPHVECLAARMDDRDGATWLALSLLFDEISHSAKAGTLHPEKARALRPILEDMVREEWGPDSKWARSL